MLYPPSQSVKEAIAQSRRQAPSQNQMCIQGKPFFHREPKSISGYHFFFESVSLYCLLAKILFRRISSFAILEDDIRNIRREKSRVNSTQCPIHIFGIGIRFSISSYRIIDTSADHARPMNQSQIIKNPIPDGARITQTTNFSQCLPPLIHDHNASSYHIDIRMRL